MADYRLNPDGPHSADYTRHAAQAFAEAVRVLNYATRTRDGVPRPATLNSVLGDLAAGAQRMDQALRQLAERLTDFVGTGQLADVSGHDDEVFADVRNLLMDARNASVVLAARLDRAFNATSGLYLRDRPDVRGGPNIGPDAEAGYRDEQDDQP
jgi:hypothetical protein